MIGAVTVLSRAVSLLNENGLGVMANNLKSVQCDVAELISAVAENRMVAQDFANDGSTAMYSKWDESERRVKRALDAVGGAS